MSRENKLAAPVLSTGYNIMKLLSEILCNQQAQAKCEEKTCQEFAFDIRRFDLNKPRCINISTNPNLEFSLPYTFFRLFLFIAI
jgi:hypothetical protein